MRRSLDNGSTTQLRRRIAIEAARLVAEQGLRDFHLAKVKAASNLGLGESAPLPRNSEIEDALREHQRLFQTDSQPRQLARLRDAALEAMEFLSTFQPRLVGAVLEGTADIYSAVCLHVFSDNPDEVAVFLGNHKIPFEQQERSMRTSKENTLAVPVFVISAGDTAIDLSVFPLDGLRQAPLDRISERPMQRAARNAVANLIKGG